MLSRVGVISCSHAHWIRSSRVMGRRLAEAAGYPEGESLVHIPIDARGFAAVLPEAELLILHTHGSPTGLYDFRADRQTTTIARLEEIAEMPRAEGVRLAVVTACEVAGGDPSHNLASVLSTRISPRGIVLANRYVVWGEDYDFGDRAGRHGWVAYREGRLLLPEDALPASLTMADAYRILVENSG